MALSKKLLDRTQRLQGHFHGFYEDLKNQANCEVAVPHDEAFMQWVFVKLASLELSMESICEAVNKGVEMQWEALKDIEKLKRH